MQLPNTIVSMNKDSFRLNSQHLMAELQTSNLLLDDSTPFERGPQFMPLAERIRPREFRGSSRIHSVFRDIDRAVSFAVTQCLNVWSCRPL